MKRSKALAPLSRDHHHGLVVAQALKRAHDPATAAEARERFLDFWQADGRRHFRVEEEVLLPGAAVAVSATDPSVVRVLTDHVDIRRRAAELSADAEPALERLNELGERLGDHIRHEERILFPLIEAALDEARLERLADDVARAERDA